MANKDIIQELNELGSSLANAELRDIYLVPKGYFEGFASQVLGLIKIDEKLVHLPKETPYQIPTGYFVGLEERIMEAIRNHADYQTSKEELESISPLLNSLNKRPVYTVPNGYFENFKVAAAPRKTEIKIIPLTNRKWFRYAAAAIITGVIALAGLVFYTSKNTPGPIAKFEKEVKKIDDVKKTETLIDLMDAGLNEKELASNHKTVRTDDVQRLLQDVSSDELKDFNEESKDIEDVMMTN
jgi:hypothetical protein